MRVRSNKAFRDPGKHISLTYWGLQIGLVFSSPQIDSKNIISPSEHLVIFPSTPVRDM